MQGIWDKPLDGTRDEQIALLRWHRDRHRRHETQTDNPTLQDAHRFAADQIDARLARIEQSAPDPTPARSAH